MVDEDPDESEDGVLSPDELDVRDDDRVRELDDNRFFVSTSDDPGDPSGLSRPAGPDRAPDDRSPAPAPDRASTPDAARDPGDGRPLRDALAGVDGRYAIAAAARTDAGTATRAVGSNNVAETFEAFLRWYADRVGDGETPDEEVLRILLAETDLDL